MSSAEVKTLEDEIAALQETLQNKKAQLHQLKTKQEPHSLYTDMLSKDEVVRYSRQMLLPQISKLGQIDLKNSKVLVVGAGGLGCPASLYLAAAGVGEIHIMDYDQVELSNLHRQVLHYETDLGLPKVQSACDKLTNINSEIVVVPLHVHASSWIAENIENHKYDVVLDCCDNAPTRYLLNDVCVMQDIPLVSGSALQMEGQLTVYHYNGGPCYRCLFPKPPPAHTVTNCGDGGVLGPVAGVIGVLQALETIKILTNTEGVLSGRLLLFDGLETIFRNVKLRQKVAGCDVCGNTPKITSPVDYELFCGSKAHDKVVDIDVLKSDDNVGVEQLRDIFKEKNIVVDVRPELEYGMCRLPNTFNLPFSRLKTNKGLHELEEIIKSSPNSTSVYLLCRRGNDSQRSVDYLQQNFQSPTVKFFNIKGGLHAYAKFVDSSFPVY